MASSSSSSTFALMPHCFSARQTQVHLHPAHPHATGRTGIQFSSHLSLPHSTKYCSPPLPMVFSPTYTARLSQVYDAKPLNSSSVTSRSHLHLARCACVHLFHTPTSTLHHLLPSLQTATKSNLCPFPRQGPRPLLPVSAHPLPLLQAI